jgi:SAM-dependent methyltransferase
VCEHHRVATDESSPYRRDLALVHHLGFADHAEACAPGLIGLLAPVRDRGGVAVELGCGSGVLTAALVASGFRVVATDASSAMLELARRHVRPGPERFERLCLPDDPLPPADAVVGVGHVLNYLADRAAIDRALTAIAGALRPGGLLALDVCGAEFAAARRGTGPRGRTGPDWAIITELSQPAPDRLVRDMTTFVPNGDGTWRRDTERHENVLVEGAALLPVLARHGVEAYVAPSFGAEVLPRGLSALIGHKA